MAFARWSQPQTSVGMWRAKKQSCVHWCQVDDRNWVCVRREDMFGGRRTDGLQPARRATDPDGGTPGSWRNPTHDRSVGRSGEAKRPGQPALISYNAIGEKYIIAGFGTRWKSLSPDVWKAENWRESIEDWWDGLLLSWPHAGRLLSRCGPPTKHRPICRSGLVFNRPTFRTWHDDSRIPEFQNSRIVSI